MNWEKLNKVHRAGWGWPVLREWAKKSAVAAVCGGVLLSGAGSAAAGPVKLNVVGADVRSVLLSTARQGNLSLVLDDAVTGSVSVNLWAEPAEALELIAAAKGLTVEQVGNAYIITGPGHAGALRHVHVYQLHYADPDNVAPAVELALAESGMPAGNGKPVRQADKTAKPAVRAASVGKTAVATPEKAAAANAATGRVAVDRATSSLIFYGTNAEARAVESVLAALDVPTQQIALEARVVALSKDASKELGVEWDWSKLPQYPELNKTYRHRGTSNETAEYDVKRQWHGGEQVPGIIQFGHGPEGVPFEFYYEAKINAMVTDGKARILARPNITTVQGREASIVIGNEVPVPKQSVTDSTTTTSLEYRMAGIILRCTPRVEADGHITAAVHTEVSSPLYVDDIKAYRFQTRSADTTVRLQDGETMVIGGLIGSDETRRLAKIPFLGDLPVLGSFFRSQSRSHTDSEVMIFLRARTVDDAVARSDVRQAEARLAAGQSEKRKKK